MLFQQVTLITDRPAVLLSQLTSCFSGNTLNLRELIPTPQEEIFDRCYRTGSSVLLLYFVTSVLWCNPNVRNVAGMARFKDLGGFCIAVFCVKTPLLVS